MTFSVPLEEHAKTTFPEDVDITPTAQRYVGFFENVHGEQLVYVHEHGVDPVVYHGDYEWKPVTVVMPKWRIMSKTVAMWVVGDLIVNLAEALWLAACLSASNAVDGNPAEAIATSFVNGPSA